MRLASFSVDINKKTILIDGVEYWPTPRGVLHAESYQPTTSHLIPRKNKNWYTFGGRNAFIYNEDSDSAIKLFGKCMYIQRQLSKITFLNDNLKKFLWQQCNRAQIEKIAEFHGRLSKEGLAPKCGDLISFNNDLFYGLEMEKINGTFAWWKDHDETFRRRVREGLRKAGMNRGRMDVRKNNVILCSKTQRLMYIDIEYQHLPSSMK
jgi:hypothetical protein